MQICGVAARATNPNPTLATTKHAAQTIPLLRCAYPYNRLYPAQPYRTQFHPTRPPPLPSPPPPSTSPSNSSPLQLPSPPLQLPLPPYPIPSVYQDFAGQYSGKQVLGALSGKIRAEVNACGGVGGGIACWWGWDGWGWCLVGYAVKVCVLPPHLSPSLSTQKPKPTSHAHAHAHDHAFGLALDHTYAHTLAHTLAHAQTHTHGRRHSHPSLPHRQK